MKLLFIISLVFTQALFANFCMCIYPEKGHEYGRDSETGFYVVGCGTWLNAQKNCRKRKMMPLGSSLKDFIDTNTRPRETIKLGYVGHSSVAGMKRYMNDYLSKVIETTSHSFIIDNTACDGLKDPKVIHDIVKGYKLDPNQYISVKANQVISVGVWDKVYPRFRRANLYAITDSRYKDVYYPDCLNFLGRGCSATFQHNEKGLCKLNGELTEIKCTNKKVQQAKVRALSPLHKLLGNTWFPSNP